METETKTNALFCDKCGRGFEISAVGKCSNCRDYIGCASHKYCGKCSVKFNACCVCGKDIPSK